MTFSLQRTAYVVRLETALRLIRDMPPDDARMPTPRELRCARHGAPSKGARMTQWEDSGRLGQSLRTVIRRRCCCFGRYCCRRVPTGLLTVAGWTREDMLRAGGLGGEPLRQWYAVKIRFTRQRRELRSAPCARLT